MTPRALLFDLDDTLLETRGPHEAALRHACSWGEEQLGVPEPALRRGFERNTRRLEEALRRGEFRSHAEYRVRVWSDTLAQAGLPPAASEELARRYLEERRRRYRLFDDVPELLPSLAGAYRLVLVTNGLEDLQREKIAAVSLGRWFEACLISGEVGSWKPDPAIFRSALERAGSPAGAAVMIGDSLPMDIRGARSVGIRTVWMRRYPAAQNGPVPPGAGPDAAASDLRALLQVLAAWQGGGTGEER